jgi:hypothetical protein
MERGESNVVTLALRRHHRRQCVIHTGELVESPYQFDERARLQEDQPTIDVVIREGAKGFVAQRNLLTQSIGFRRIEVSAGRNRPHDLVDPTQSVDGDLFNEQLFDVADLVDR